MHDFLVPNTLFGEKVVRIRREAFPMRVSYKQFYRRFGNLLSSKYLPPAEDVTQAQVKSEANRKYGRST